TLQGGFAVALADDSAEASFGAPAPWPVLKGRIPWTAMKKNSSGNFSWEGTEYIIGSARVGDHGRILVAMPLPANFSETVQQVEASQKRYWDLAKERRLVRRTYMSLLMLLTVLVLFATTWLALFLSKLVTRPVAALAEAMQEISRGRLDYRVVGITAGDELGDLVAKFNAMAGELEVNRRQIESSSHELAAANVQIEQRRRQME